MRLTWDENVHTIKSDSDNISISNITPYNELNEFLEFTAANWEILLSLIN